MYHEIKKIQTMHYKILNYKVLKKLISARINDCICSSRIIDIFGIIHLKVLPEKKSCRTESFSAVLYL